jgi:uncharacterized protein (TIGR04222 family)
MGSDPYLGVMAALVVLSIALRMPPARRRGSWDLGCSEYAYLRGGQRAVVLAALAAMHQRGIVQSARRGTVKRAGSMKGISDPVERALGAALHGQVSPSVLAARPQVRRALATLQAGLVAGGLLLPTWRWAVLRVTAVAVLVVGVAGLITGPRTGLLALLAGVLLAVGLWVWPRRTRAGGRVLAAARRRSAQLTPGAAQGQPGWSAEDVGMAVALHGAAALRALMPTFARDGGLFDRRAVSDTHGDATLDTPNPNI